MENAGTEELIDALLHTLNWSRKQGYLGWNKHDGLNSPILRQFFNWGKWPRIIAIQGVMRFPVNLRPLLQIPKVYNPKGLALFAHAWLDLYRMEENPECLAEAEKLLRQLEGMTSPGNWSGACWGYHYPWCDPAFYAPSNTPNAVVTAFVCEAFLEGFRLTRKQHYLEIVGSAIGFFLNDLKILKEEPDELCLSYMPLPMQIRVMDVSILIGSVVAQHAVLTNNNYNLTHAVRLINYVVRQQTNEGAWYYTDPPEDSHIRHDNYHTGFILDALSRYMETTGDRRWLASYETGLKFYAERLFNEDGSPRWMSGVDYPHDIHGAAQGILTFSRHQDIYPGMARKIADWALHKMYHQEGRFYYQETRLMIKKYTLLRWCNAWMARALAAYLLGRQE